jgi:hypothetical protein
MEKIKKRVISFIGISMLFFVFMPSSINAQILNKNSSVSYFKYKKIGEEEVIDPQLKTRDSIEIYKKLNAEKIISIIKAGGEIWSKPFGIVLYRLQEAKEIIILNYKNDYFEIKTDLFQGYVQKDFIQTTVEVLKLQEIKEEESLKRAKEEVKKQQQIEESIEKERLTNLAIEEKKAKENNALIEKKNIAKYGIKLYSKLKNGYVWLGMTKDMAIISLGNPKEVNRSTGVWGVHEQWVYNTSYYYFENGIMTSYQD